jgi:pimeloyl-ACP methyl ester carboxylesterase
VTVDAPAVVVAGPPDGPPIVLIHGTGLSKAAWAPQLAGRLADSYRVIALDLPGHGASAQLPFTLDGAATEVGRVIDSTAGGRAAVIGLSLGGYVAMELVASRPAAVRGLVLVGASQEPVGLRAVPYLALALALDGLDRLDPRLVSGIAAALLRLRFPASIAEPIIEGGVHAAGGSVALRTLVGRRFRSRLAAYAGPVLLLNGEFDVLFRSGSKGFAEAGGDVRRARLRGAAHLANLDRPAAFDAAIRRFMEGLDGRS